MHINERGIAENVKHKEFYGSRVKLVNGSHWNLEVKSIIFNK